MGRSNRVKEESTPQQRQRHQREVNEILNQTRSTRSQQPSQSQSTRSQRNAQNTSTQSNESLNDSITDVGETHMFFVKMVKLILNYSSNKIPFKRPDLVEKSLGGNGQIFKKVFELAKKSLNEIYGINVVEVPSNKKFICVATFPAASELDNKNQQNKQTTLLFVILSYIFMKGGTVAENTLNHFLKKFGMEMDEEHNYFGNVKSLIELFYKQLYLTKEKFTQEGQNETIFQVSWGQRADLEVPKKDLLEAVAKLYEKPTICFRQQHMEVYGSLQNPEEIMATQAQPEQMETDE